MSVSNTPRIKIYTGNGEQLVFPYDFRIFKAEDLIVEKYTIETGISETLVLDSDYTVSDVGVLSGGDVTLLIAAPENTHKIIIDSRIPNEQTMIDLQEGGSIPAESLESALDMAAMRDQQLQDQIDRCVKIDPGSEVDPSELVATLNDAVAAAIAAKSTAEAVAADLAGFMAGTFTTDVEMPIDKHIYIGDKNTNGSWRIRIDGNDLVNERRESGIWTEKGRATA
jgi:hypothetical protein